MNLHLQLISVKSILDFLKDMPLMKTLAPKQARSRQSLKRLLQAASSILEEKGLDGATIPLIAARAGLSPGAVYRRFRDKDALLRTLLLETLEGTYAHNQATLTAELTRKYSLAALTKKIVATTLQSYRKHCGLMRALTQFARSHPSAPFRKKIDELEVRNFQQIVDFLRTKCDEIQHPHPEIAMPFGLMLIALALREMVILEVLSKSWSPLMPNDDEQLVDELTRMLLNYLGCGA